MSGWRILRAGLAMGIALTMPAAAIAQCAFPTINLGSLLAGSRSTASFARQRGGTIETGSAMRFRARISGCPEAGEYRLTTGTAAPIRLNNGRSTFDVVPFAISVNGTPLVQPIDLTRPEGLRLAGNPEVEIVAAIDQDAADLAAGTYSGGFVMQFVFDN